MWTTPLLAALALAEPPAPAPTDVAPVPAPAPAPVAAPAPTPAPAPYGTQPPPGYQPYGYPPPGQPYGYGYPPPPPPNYPPPEPPQPRRRGKGMMIAGWSIFGGTWITSIVIGAGYLDYSSPNSQAIGRRLMIPVLGPFLAIGTGEELATTTMAFAFLGAAQAAGLALGIAGTVMFARSGRESRATAAGFRIGRNSYLSAGPRWGGGGVNLSMRF